MDTKTMKIEQTKHSSAWSWKNLTDDLIVNEQNKNKKQSKANIMTSLLVAFFIVIIAGQTLGFINDIAEKQNLLEKYKNINVVVYSNIG